MSKSSRSFDRWVTHDASTWVFQVFRQYNDELYRLLGCHAAAKSYVYKNLKQNGAQWVDRFDRHFKSNELGFDYYHDLKTWSESYGEFENWVNLSAIMSISSNLETYVASAVSLATDSDPGVVLGASRSVDGVSILKYRKNKPLHLDVHIESCTKGTWGERLGGFERLFGPCPKGMRSPHAELEEVRTIRNRFGHAFGRDINASRQHGQITKAPIDSVKTKTVLRLSRASSEFARSMDEFLSKRHIGDFEAANFYHKLYPSQHMHVSPNQRAANLKKLIGRFGAGLRGKAYCNGLVAYWEAL